MMYYLIGFAPNIELKEVENVNSATYGLLKEQGYEINGQFGRKDFADIWCDFYNGKINRDELKIKLDKITD